MKNMRAMITILFAASFITTSVRAEEESEKVRKARLENEIEKEAESTDQKCGTKLAAKINWATFDADKNWEGKSVSGYCEAPLGALRNFCEGAQSKAYIQKKIKNVVCVGAKDKTAWKVVVKGDTIEWHVSPDSFNNDQYAKKELLKNL